MNYNIKIKILLFLCAINITNIYGQDDEPTIVLDSITNHQLALPKGSTITSHPNSSFLRFYIETPKSIISIYSKRSQEKKAYTWSEVNKFVKEKNLGQIDSTKRIAGGLDGWHIFHTNRTKDYKPYSTCATTIKGKYNVMYIIESAYNSSDLTTPYIIENSTFKGSKVKKKSARRVSNTDLVVAFIVVCSSFLYYFVKEKASLKQQKWTISITTVILIVYYLLFSHTTWLFFGLSIGLNIYFWYCSLNKDTDAITNMIKTISSNL